MKTGMGVYIIKSCKLEDRENSVVIIGFSQKTASHV